MLFVPHLVPTVRGVLTTCYAPMTGDDDHRGSSRDLPRPASYAAAPFVRVLAAGRHGRLEADPRHQHVSSSRRSPTPGPGQAIVVGALDNLVKGAAGQAIQNMNLMLGTRRGRRPAGDGVVPMSVTYPRGSGGGRRGRSQAERAAGPRAVGGRPRRDGGRGCSRPTSSPRHRSWSAASGSPPARPTAVLVNSGQANAGTGERGAADAAAAQLPREHLGLDPEAVLPCSTGVIGEPVHMTELLAGLAGARRVARSVGGGHPPRRFSDTIRSARARPATRRRVPGRWAARRASG